MTWVALKSKTIGLLDRTLNLGQHDNSCPNISRKHDIHNFKILFILSLKVAGMYLGKVLCNISDCRSFFADNVFMKPVWCMNICVYHAVSLQINNIWSRIYN